MASSEIEWQRSTRCASGACVEVAFTASFVGVRNSRDAEPRRVLTFSYAFWEWMIKRFKRSESVDLIEHPVSEAGEHVVWWQSGERIKSVTFTNLEWRAFLDGLALGEFDPPADIPGDGDVPWISAKGGDQNEHRT